ncbi:MAG: hypothetical protein ACRDAX_00340 [Propionibacteriaceae bacterium]
MKQFISAIALIVLLTACSTPSKTTPITANSTPTAAASQDRSKEPLSLLPDNPPRFNGTHREFMIALVDCIKSKGYPTDYPLPGEKFISNKGPMSKEQHVGSLWAMYDCQNEIGNVPLPKSSEHNLRIMYDTAIKQVTCFRSYGVKVDDIPSFESYTAVFRGEPSTDWSINMYLNEKDPIYPTVIDKCDEELLQTEPFEE